MDGGTVEQRLVEAIAPLRHFALAHALYAFLDTGLHAGIEGEPGIDAGQLAARHALAPERVESLLRYLANEGYVTGTGPGWSLTASGREIGVFRPWFRLLVGGYGATFAQLGPALASTAGWAERNGAEVAVGACGMSMFDAVPLADRLLAAVTPNGPVTVVDLGCGDGSFLAELARRRPQLRGIGLEPDPSVSELGRRTIAAAGAADRVEVVARDAISAPSVALPGTGPVCYLAAFVLQELLEQTGRDAVVELLAEAGRDRPDTWWMVLEVDHVVDDPRLRTGLGRAFYNPYYLLHAITEQRLVDRAAWLELFELAGLEVVAIEHPDPDVDSTDLMLGFLARHRDPS